MAAPVTLPFAHSERSSIGIEWEVALVDADSGDLRQAAETILAAVRPADGGEHPLITQELLLNTVELRSGKCTTVAEAVADLQRALDIVGEAAEPLRIELMGSGTHPFAQWSQQRVTDKQRYATLIDRTQWWGRQMLIYGVHVHVGIEDRAKVLPISRAMLTVFAHIQSLSASSPVLGRQGHRVRLEPRAAVPAAAHRGPAVRVRRLVAAGAVRRRHDAHGRDRPVRRGPLGRAARRRGSGRSRCGSRTAPRTCSRSARSRR